MVLRTEKEITASWKNHQDIMVSVCTTTYNHEKFIRQTIDGILMQETDFPFEILIFDDASVDNNQLIIKEYASKYPTLFRLFLQKENQWQKKIGGSLSFTFPNAKGKYIALCEGDDYWTSPFKLQKQVNFLENNEDYSMCSHNSATLTHTGKVLFDNQLLESTFTTKDVIQNDWQIMTATIMFRRDLLFPIQDWLFKVINLDYALQLYFSTRGKIKFLPDCMSVYRRHLGGMTALFSPLVTINSMYTILYYFNKYTHGEYKAEIKQKMLQVFKSQIQVAKQSRFYSPYIKLLVLYYLCRADIEVFPFISGFRSK